MLPFLALLVVGSVDLGRAYFSYMSVINAAREGARYGAYHPTESANILSHARNEVDQNFINLTNLSVGQRCTDSSGNTASCAYLNAIEVTVSYPFRLFTTEAVGGTVITLSAKEAMEIYVK